MQCTKVKVADPLGVHARTAFILSDLAKGFSSSIWLKNNRGLASLTRPLEILKLQLRYQDEVLVMADGLDEKDALEMISHKLSEI